jgi:hypothetical protein
MAWSTPYTWTVGEILTAAKLQTYLSDELTFLKSLDNYQMGWIPVAGAWSYASASTITVPAGAASIYNKGYPIRWKQGAGYKYGNLAAVADTLLTIIVNSDYVVANSAITDMYYSPIPFPLDFPTLFNYASTLSGSTGSIGTYAEASVVSFYRCVGRRCHVVIGKQITNKGSWATNVQMQVPVVASATYTGIWTSLYSSIIAAGAAWNANKGWVVPAASTTFLWYKTMATNVLQWADLAVNDYVQCDFEYIF